MCADRAATMPNPEMTIDAEVLRIRKADTKRAERV